MRGYKSQVTHTQKDIWIILERVSDVQEVSAKQVMKKRQWLRHQRCRNQPQKMLGAWQTMTVLLRLSKRFHPVAILTQTEGP